MDMFGFASDMGNYEVRKIARFEEGNLFVDTCSVSDGRQNYETAVEHPEYNDGRMVVVEAYDTPEEAQEGHDRWVAKMTQTDLPDQLEDCMNAHISELMSVFGEHEMIFQRIKP